MGLGLALVCLLAAPAAAQQPAAPGSKPAASGGTIGENIGDISVSYKYLNVTQMKSGVRVPYTKGFDIQAAKRVTWGMSLVAEFSGAFGNNIQSINTRVAQAPAHFFTYQAGIRFSTKRNALASGRRMMIKPFAQMLFGGANDNATQMNHFSTLLITGGADFQLGNKAAVRVQAGLPMFLFFGPVTLGYQAMVGMVVPFSK